VHREYEFRARGLKEAIISAEERVKDSEEEDTVISGL
jgi:hypothetical protein